MVVDGDELPCLCQEERHVTVAAEPTVDGLDHMTSEGRRNDGVQCVPAVLKDPSTGLCFLAVATRDDAAIRDELRPGRGNLAKNHRCPAVRVDS